MRATRAIRPPARLGRLGESDPLTPTPYLLAQERPRLQAKKCTIAYRSRRASVCRACSGEDPAEELPHVLPGAPIRRGVIRQRDAVLLAVGVGFGVRESVFGMLVGDEAVLGPRLIHL